MLSLKKNKLEYKTTIASSLCRAASPPRPRPLQDCNVMRWPPTELERKKESAGNPTTMPSVISSQNVAPCNPTLVSEREDSSCAPCRVELFSPGTACTGVGIAEGKSSCAVFITCRRSGRQLCFSPFFFFFLGLYLHLSSFI